LRETSKTVAEQPVYPFSALVGAEDLALALILNALSPAIGGVLVRGEKGTAKSTAVRGLAALLPAVEVVAGCRFSCDPVSPDPDCPDGPHSADAPVQSRPARLVELPVGASEDRVAGSLDLERALVEGRRAFEPGLLARAHRGVLYVDEVNLLGDHLVDLLLDAAAMGTNHVEREGVSVRHAARFQLVGTMNPEEGELRPQLLDRFGLTAEVRASRDPVLRAEVVRRRLAYEADPAAFVAAWAGADAEVAARIRAARTLLAEVTLGERALEAVVAACAAFDVDGLRADIVTAKAACALAAWDGRTEVCMTDVRTAALLALPHRRRRGPFESPGVDPAELDDVLGRFGHDPEEPDDPGGTSPCGQGSSRMRDEPWPQGPTQLPVGTTFRPTLFQLARTSTAGPLGRRSPAQAERGHHVGDRSPRGRVTDVALAATIRTAAVRGGWPLRLRAQDLREKVLQGREGNLVLFVVDASGSMAARRRMSAVKGAIASLLLDAYQRRDRVGLVTFAGAGAQVPLAPTASVERAARLLADLETGGRTPIAAGLERAAEVLAVERVRDPRRRPLLVLLTDGRVTAGGDPVAAATALAARGVPAVVVDTEDGHVKLGLAGAIARALQAPWLRLSELVADSLAGVVRTLTAPGSLA
jgi:magnesium chelatase subunit D